MDSFHCAAYELFSADGFIPFYSMYRHHVSIVFYYSAVNNYKLEHIFRVTSFTFPRNHWSYLDMLNEIVS